MSQDKKRQRVVLVIGGTGGIGEAIVTKLATSGMAVAIHYSGNQQKALNLEGSLHQQGLEMMTVTGDISDEKEVQAIFSEIENTWGGVDVLVNTAGIMKLSKIEDLDLEDFDKMFRVNTRGHFLLAKYAAKHLRSGGAFIALSTTVTRTQFPMYGAYVASKAAVESLTLTLARELRGKDITVNTVSPGPTATPFFFEGKTEEMISNFSKAAPLERLGTPEDIADIVHYLASGARWINGQTIFANGGLA
ncbi:SDR family oxidoreductase [Exiguobacterium sp. s22]|uniref:SDR family oxidoreductase n=1 Tax=Exiguobacterium sp. s22 TaxID=2751272 RepID=UPI001BE64E30|nr:SDR family oxidoreductase [Exiguobacterium sp. s22]